MPDDKPAVPPQELSIEIDETTAHGIYANLALVSHSETEFVVDFIFHAPHPPKAKVRARILTSPIHMKRLLVALQENVARYEGRFGPIPSAPQPPSGPKVGFYH
jgi:hypothetical protein